MRLEATQRYVFEPIPKPQVACSIHAKGTRKPWSAIVGRRLSAVLIRRTVSRDEVADALDRLVDAGFADREGEHEWVLRAKGSEAWIRLRFSATA